MIFLILKLDSETILQYHLIQQTLLFISQYYNVHKPVKQFLIQKNEIKEKKNSKTGRSVFR